MNNMDNRYSSKSGQIGIIILLMMTVLLTVGLSLAANTNRELMLAEQGADSTRVFNAAEAGVEDALSGELTFSEEPMDFSLDTVENVNVDYQVTSVRNLETRLSEGRSIEVNVDTATGGDRLVIDWAHDDGCTDKDSSIASLFVSVFYDDGGTTLARYYTFRGCSWDDDFTGVDESGYGPYHRRARIDLTDDDLFVRIKPIYNDTHIRVSGGGGYTLPYQGFVIRSTASSDVGNETRIVEVNRTLPAAPSVMDYAVVSGTTINKE